MAYLTGSMTKTLLLTVTLSACSIVLTACGPNTRDRDLSERLATANARNGAAAHVPKATQENPVPDLAPDAPEDADAAPDPNADPGEPDFGQPDYGSPTDPTSADDDFGNDLSAGMDAAPDDFPAPQDPPMVDDISPNDMPTSE